MLQEKLAVVCARARKLLTSAPVDDALVMATMFGVDATVLAALRSLETSSSSDSWSPEMDELVHESLELPTHLRYMMEVSDDEGIAAECEALSSTKPHKTAQLITPHQLNKCKYIVYSIYTIYIVYIVYIVYTYVYIHIHTQVRSCIYIYTHMYICTYTYTYTYNYIYIHS